MTWNYLPSNVSPDQVKVCLGLMSDTHMPSRWPKLHETFIQIFADVDMILHAGDVGELWALDELSWIAPVVAVHGNDEPPETPTMLPEKQIVTVLSPELQALAAEVQPTPEMYDLLWQLAPACCWGGKEMITREDIKFGYRGKLCQ